MNKHIALIALMVSVAGCKAQIPNRVTADEYAIYSTWMNQYFSKHAPNNLYLSSHTFKFPSETGGCTNEKLRDAGVPSSLIEPLRDLGDAEYGLAFDDLHKNLLIPWKYEVVGDWEPIPEERMDYRWIGFSRVAFNRAHDKALFAISDTCGGLCGHGGPVYAHKENGAWVFENVGCFWVS
jgi:hypothetical protein